MPTGVYKRKQTYVSFTCKYCNKTKHIHPTQAKTKKFCSRRCTDNAGRSEETKEKCRQSACRQFKNGMPQETKDKMRNSHLNIPLSKEHSKKIGESQLNEKHWRFDKNPSYLTIHKWLYRNFGKATHCENIMCSKESKLYSYAKIKNKKYERKRENFIQLCWKCHMLYDNTHSEKIKLRK